MSNWVLFKKLAEIGSKSRQKFYVRLAFCYDGFPTSELSASGCFNVCMC